VWLTECVSLRVKNSDHVVRAIHRIPLTDSIDLQVKHAHVMLN